MGRREKSMLKDWWWLRWRRLADVRLICCVCVRASFVSWARACSLTHLKLSTPHTHTEWASSVCVSHTQTWSLFAGKNYFALAQVEKVKGWATTSGRAHTIRWVLLLFANQPTSRLSCRASKSVSLCALVTSWSNRMRAAWILFSLRQTQSDTHKANSQLNSLLLLLLLPPLTWTCHSVAMRRLWPNLTAELFLLLLLSMLLHLCVCVCLLGSRWEQQVSRVDVARLSVALSRHTYS